MPALEIELENEPHPCLSGKIQGQSLMATHVTGQLPSRLFYVIDCTTCLCFFFDTAAQVSIIAPSGTNRKKQHANLDLGSTSRQRHGSLYVQYLFPHSRP